MKKRREKEWIGRKDKFMDEEIKKKKKQPPRKLSSLEITGGGGEIRRLCLHTLE